MTALGLQPWQWWVIGAVYVTLFLLPSVWMWRKARRDGDAPLTWALLVALGSFLGVLEYYHHRSILKRRAKRAARAARDVGNDAVPGPGPGPGPHEDRKGEEAPLRRKER